MTEWKIDIRPESGFYGEDKEDEEKESIIADDTDILPENTVENLAEIFSEEAIENIVSEDSENNTNDDVVSEDNGVSGSE